MAEFDDPTAIFQTSLTKLSAILPKKLALQLLAPPQKQVLYAVETALNWGATSGCHLVSWADPRYPTALKNMYDPPMLLYVEGDLGCLTKPSIAIVGTRDASSYGLEVASQLAHDLAQAGWCVVSGLARGIDAAAHQGALVGANQLATLAVMGHGLNMVYPPQNKGLARHILDQHGALLSELSPDQPPRPHQFPRRNRLVAGLVRGVIVVEATHRSGSLITARLANELGRDVFAVPGPVSSPASQGVHALIKQGACLIEHANDVLKEFGCDTKPIAAQSSDYLNHSNATDDSGQSGDAEGSNRPYDSNMPCHSRGKSTQTNRLTVGLQNNRSPTQVLLLKLIGGAPTLVSQLLLHTKLTPQAMNIELTYLELEGLILREGHGVVFALKGVGRII
jgi:DNA processing protein